LNLFWFDGNQQTIFANQLLELSLLWDYLFAILSNFLFFYKGFGNLRESQFIEATFHTNCVIAFITFSRIYCIIVVIIYSIAAATNKCSLPRNHFPFNSCFFTQVNCGYSFLIEDQLIVDFNSLVEGCSDAA